ncbi:MAG: S41 family peptidase [Acidobacteria bacterium]|nr:S41 family peptidase [Acidobacteriota bacterium]
MSRLRALPVAVTAVVVSALVGGVLGRSALATGDRVADRYKVFTAALAAIETEYVEPVESDRIVYGAIGGLLQTLDPHSSFLDPRTYAQLRERQEGRYYGLGITIQVIDGDITVVALFEGSPAYRRGIRRGDVIARIKGEDTKGWTSDQAVKELRGPKGSTVAISIRRQGFDSLVDLEVERDEISIPTILGAFMIDDRTGYVRLRDFSETTDRDLGRSLDELAGKGMTQLLLDLRDNPGGPLDQAIKVSNRFLQRGDMIVYTRGRVPNSDQDYRAASEPTVRELPIVVLVNRNSASAAEIVAGALQDHDRAYVAGETTFGKALVQSIYRISQGAGLALTTARYYTPSGRLIQRPFDGAFDEYLSYTWRDQAASRAHEAGDEKETEGGRKVFSGGGIEPDAFIAGPVEGFNPTRFGRLLYARRFFAAFAQRFSAEGDTRLGGQAKGQQVVSRGFEVTDRMVGDFRAFLESEKVRIDDAAFEKDLEFIRAMIRYEVDVELFGVEDARRHLIARDPQAQFALGLFPEAIKLSELSRTRTTAGRVGR